MSRPAMRRPAMPPSTPWSWRSVRRWMPIPPSAASPSAMSYGRPEIDTEAVIGAPAIKSGTVEVIVEYETATPLG